MHNKRQCLIGIISEKPKGRASKSKEMTKRRVGSKKEVKRRAWELPPPPKKEGSSAAIVEEDKGYCTVLRLLKVTDGGHRVEERITAVKELQDRGVGIRPLVLQKGVDDGKVGGLNSGSDDPDLSEEWAIGFEVPVSKDGVNGGGVYCV